MELSGILMLVSCGAGLIVFAWMQFCQDSAAWIKATLGVVLGLAIAVLVVASCCMIFSESSRAFAY